MIGRYLKALGELVSHWSNLVFWVVDLLYLLIGALGNKYTPEPPVLIAFLAAGLVVSSVRLVVSKNHQLVLYNLHKPEISLDLRKVDSKTVLRVRNLSNVPLKDFSFSPVSVGGFIQYQFTIEGTNILEQDEERTLGIKSESEFADLSHFGKYANDDYETEVGYKDFANNTYTEIFNLGKSGIKVIGST